MGKKLTSDLSSMNSNDIELYTPKFMVDVIIPYLDKSKTIWCPFDLESSNFVRYLRTKGFKVISSHILNNEDFLKYEPKEHWDMILSNPPFKDKKKWVKRAESFNKPFGFIFPIMWMNDISWNEMHEKNKFEIIIPDRRISFDGSTKTCAFKSAYFTSGYSLGKTITIIKINPVEEYIPMYDEMKNKKESV